MKFFHFYKTIIIFIAAGISSVGTMPYAFRFASQIEPNYHLLAITIGTLFAITAAFSNLALGASSLLSIDLKKCRMNPYLLVSLSLLSAIPTGFMFYFGYLALLPLVLNITASIAVILVNTAIGFMAISNLIAEFKKNKAHFAKGELIARWIGFVAGLLVSVTIYMVSIHGLAELFNQAYLTREIAFKLACGLGIITWLPYAALYANATQIVTNKIYLAIINFSATCKNFAIADALLFLIAWLAGTSFAQIALDFFNPCMDTMPLLFKQPFMQAGLHYYFIPLVFLSSVAVNYLALKNLKCYSTATKNEPTYLDKT